MEISKLVKRVTGILILSGIFLLVAIRLVNSIDFRNNDFFTFWLAGHMTWSGQLPYDAAAWTAGHVENGVTWIPNDRFVYPLPLSLIYAPLGLLSLYHAYITWVFLSEWMILLSVIALFSLQKINIPKHQLVILLTGLLLYRPTLISLSFGQISPLLLLILSLALLSWKKRRWLQTGALLSLLALKPNLGVPILVVWSFWLLKNRNYRTILWMVFSGILLILLGMLLDKNWVVEYLSIGNTKMSQAFGFSPTLWGLAAYLTKFDINKTVWLGGIACGALLAWVFYLIMQVDKPISSSGVLNIAITVTLLITPYTWPYDQLLLLFPITLTVAGWMVDKKYSLLPASSVIFLDLVALGLLRLSAELELEIFNAIIPLIVLGVLMVQAAPKQRARLTPETT